jgi:cobalt-zinc-cadmium efflux system membrane fusion protein
MHVKPATVVLCGALTLALAGALIPVFAHEGHAKVETAPFDLDSPRRPSPETAAYIGLKTAEVDFGPVEQVVQLGGIVRAMPDRVQVVQSRVAGTVTRVWVRPGDTVKQGDLLAEVASPELARLIHEALKSDVEFEHLKGEVVAVGAGLEQMRSQIESAEQQARLAEAEVARLEKGGDAVGANEISQRKAAAIQARSQVTILQMTRAQQQRELESLTRMQETTGKSIAALRGVIDLIRDEPVEARKDGPGAPPPVADTPGLVRMYAWIDGVVTRREATNGQGVLAGQLLLQVADYRRVQVEGELPESIVARLGEGGAAAGGKEVRVRRTMGGDVLVRGTVKSVSPTVDPIKRTSHLLIDADNPGGLLRDGMYVSLAVVLRQEKSAVVVPASAVISDGPMVFVFIKEGDEFKKRDITPGYRDDQSVEVLSGLVPGDVIVTTGAYSLTQLRPKARPNAPAPSPATTPDHAH